MMKYKDIVDDMMILPQTLIKNYTIINLTSEDLIVILELMIFLQNKEIPKASKIVERTDMEDEKINSIIKKLEEEEFIEIIQTKDSYVISLKKLYKKLEEFRDKNSLIDRIEVLISRKLLEDEIKIINSWVFKNIDKKLIEETLKKIEKYNYDLVKIDEFIIKVSKDKDIKIENRIIAEEKKSLF